jgi:phage antirepressor YoqD-like protein
MQNLTNTNVLTMTSSEIAELVDSRHDSVRRTIERLAADRDGAGFPKAPIIQLPPMVEVKNHQGQTVQEYLIGKRDSYIIVAQLSPEFTARLVDRWQELEQDNQFNIPQTLPDALRLAADLADKMQEQQLVIEQQKPAVEFLDRYVEAKNTKGIREVAKVLGAKEKEFVNWLLDKHFMYRQGNALLPYAHYQHSNYFEIKTGESNGHAFTQARFTPQGIAFVARHWADKQSICLQ